MNWLHGMGWNWAGCTHGVVVTVVLWGAVLAAVVAAASFLSRQRSAPLASRDTGSIRIEYVLAEGSARGDADNDQWHRRLM